MSATINAFPPLHTFNSSRSWFMAAIVLLHAGFFWALNNGLGHQILTKLGPPLLVVTPTETPRVPPKPTPIDGPQKLDRWRIVVPIPTHPIDVPGDNAIVAEAMPDKPIEIPQATEGSGPGSGPVVIEPSLDMRRFSEPLYPPAARRSGQEGTVMLSMHIGPNGKVLEVQLAQSSGFTLLDESALREARRWRFNAGTENGRAVAMWTKIPVTFRLQ
jgi:periplasmic protein TonB